MRMHQVGTERTGPMPYFRDGGEISCGISVALDNQHVDLDALPSKRVDLRHHESAI